MSVDTTSNIITITPAAIDQFRSAGVSRDEFLRITIEEGGCSGLTYSMTTDTVATPFDVTIFANEEIKAITDRNSLIYLKGLEIDYSSDLINVGFRFNNPNAVHTCGCGQSMSV